MRADLLDGLSATQRLRREQDDAAFIARENKGHNFAQREAMAVKDMRFGGSAGLLADSMTPYDETRADQIEVCICARLDLQHPLCFADNRFADCADCGCNLQHRPHTPEGPPKVCISCAARRMREKVG